VSRSSVKINGIPEFVSFDHDLGNDDTSRIFINWMIFEVLDGNLKIPNNFTYDVHSQNPIGRDWIRGTMSNFLEYAKINQNFFK
jgi:hypothetical protein